MSLPIIFEKIAVFVPDVAPKEVERYINLSMQKKVFEIEDNEILKNSTKIIVKANFNAGLKEVPDIELKMIVKEFANDLQRFYKKNSMEEIREAMDLGSKGMFGEVYGVNPKSWNEWIKSFLSQENRKKALFAATQLKEPKPDLPDEEKNKIIEQSIIECMERYKAKGEIIDSGSVIYLHLEKVGKINLSIEEKQKIFNQAKEWFVNANKFKLEDLRKLNESSTLIFEARKIALENYFKSIIEK
jgi:hypothetical protein